jgi:hypothetical protein
MKIRGLRSWLMASAGVVAFAASPALAQDAQQCHQQLEEIEQRIAQADLDQERRQGIQEVIDGARGLAETGDEQGCLQVVAELEDLVQTVEADAGALATDQEMAQDPQDPAVTDQQMAQDQPTDPAAQPVEDPAAAEDPAVAEDPAAPPVLDTDVTVVEPEDPAATEDPAMAEEPVEDPAMAEEPVEDPAMAEEPVEDPAVAEEPVEDPAVAEEPVEDPAVADAPAALTEAEIGPLAHMPASDVIGANVVNAEGETIASVHDLVTGVADDQLYAVLRVGGFLGIGARDVVVQIQELEVGPDGNIMMAQATQEQLEQLPEYDETQYATREDDGFMQ